MQMQSGWNTQGISHNNNLNFSNSQNFTNPLNNIKTTKTKKLPQLFVDLEQSNSMNPLMNQNQMMMNQNPMMNQMNKNQSNNPMMSPSAFSQINQIPNMNMNQMNMNNMNEMQNMNSMNLNNMNQMVNMNSMNNMNQMIQQSMMGQQMIQQQLMQQRQILQQQMFQNQMLSQQIMSQRMNQSIQQNSQNIINQSLQESNILNILFKVKGYANNTQLIKIQSRNDELVYDLIEKFKETTGDYEEKNKFIYNAKLLNPDLTCFEQGLTNGAIIQVINTRDVNGAN